MDPIMQSIATALAGQVATALGTGGKKALEKVRDLVRRKARDDAETSAALAAADDRPVDHPTVKALAQRLDQLAAADPEFSNELRTAGTVLHNEITAGEGGVVNNNAGTVTGTLIQARDVQGGINLG